MKDYSEWEPILDFENESPYVNPNRPWLKFKPPTVPKTLKFEPIPVHEFIKVSAKKFPNNVCVYNKPTDKMYTYRDLITYADKIGNALYNLGVKKGDAVGIMSSNCPEFIFCCLGILECGAAVVPINPLLKESEVIHIIRETGNMDTIFVHKANYRTIKKAKNEIDIKNVILIASEESKDNAIRLEEFIKDILAKPPIVEINPTEDLAALLFTGGTTGLPKGVMLTHNNLVANALSVLYITDATDEERDAEWGTNAALAVLPLCHTFGFEVLIIALFGAAMLIMFESFDPAEILEAIEYYKVKNYVGVPVMFQMLINHPDYAKRDLSSIEITTSGSAALAPELSKKWEEKVGIKVGQGYGLTEASPITHMAANWMPDIIAESVGIPIIDTDAIVANPDTLEELGPNQIGELLIRGPQVMKGYWKKPEDTEATIVNGWLRTGDIVRMDERGYFYIEGRTKEMIKYKGYKVMPKEVEEILYEHPAVLEAGVVGIPDPNIGETIKAYVVLKPEYRDGKITEQDLIDWAKEKMAAYKYPRLVEILKTLPRTAVGKVFRRRLKEMEEEKQKKQGKVLKPIEE
jgi:long-chain acyl-CoA synthetase